MFDNSTNPTKSLLGALALNGIIFAAEIIAFTYMRRYFRLIYEPRSLSVSELKRQPPLSSRLLGWPSSIFFADYRKIKDINGLDSYFFVRFLRMMIRVMLPIWLISWAVLLPLTSINTSVPGFSGLYKFTFGNINATDNPDRYIVLLVLTWIFTIWIWWNIKYEMAHYVHVRQQYLVRPSHSSTAQARTVLVTGIPPEFLTESALTRLFSHLPGGVQKVWINRDLGDMSELYNRRLKASQMLESAVTSLLNMAIKKNRKRLRNPGDGGQITELTNFVSGDPETQDTLMEELVSKHKRPSHRLPLFSWMPFSVPLLGKKVDTIAWACERIHKLNTELAQRRGMLARDIAATTGAEAQTTSRIQNIDAEKSNIVIPAVPDWTPLFGTRPVVDFSGHTYPPANGAFILFNKQIAAHIAVQTLTHHEPYRMPYSLKCVEATPEDVIWKNLVLDPYRLRVRLVLSRTVGIVLMIVWTIPVSIAAIASRIQPGHCIEKGFVWVCNFAGKVTHFFMDIFYAVLLTVLFMFVPMMFRKLARWEGTTQRTRVELSIMDRVFVFKIFNSLFLPTLSTLLFTTSSDGTPFFVVFGVSLMNADASAIVQDLTASSTFFLIFIMLQGLSGTAIGFLQAVPLAKYYVKITLFGSTPRSVYSIKYCPRTSNWGTLYPSVTLLVVVTFGYSIISPMINGFAFVTFFLLYMLYKYLFTWVNDHPPSSDTGGLFFPKAIQHVFVGLYVQQIGLCTLFFLPLGDTNRPSAIPEGALMILLIIFTAFFHDIIHNSYGPLIKFLPQTLANVSHGGNAGVEQGTPTTAVAPQPRTSSSDVDVTDYVNASASDYNQQVNDVASLHYDGSNDSDIEHTGLLTNDLRTSSPSPSARPEGLTDFSQPAAEEELPIIWLPKDPLGLIHEIERELTSYGILYSTDGAEIDSKGCVNVTTASPEEVRRDASVKSQARCPSPSAFRPFLFSGPSGPFRDHFPAASSNC